MTIRDTLEPVGKAISVRLDDEALRALRVLEAAGHSTSDAIRRALIDAAQLLLNSKALREEARRLDSDPRDRREMTATAAMMERLRAPG